MKQSLKKVDKELKENKLNAIKKHLKKIKDNKGKVLPNYSKERNHERKLKMKAVEGSNIFPLKKNSYQVIQCD
jgi:hypothetical protein